MFDQWQQSNVNARVEEAMDRATGRDKGTPKKATNQTAGKKASDAPKAPSLEAGKAFENLFELLPNAVVVVDRQARIMRVNAEAEKLFGYTREEILGKDHGILVPERLRPRHDAELKAYMDDPHPRVMGIGLNLRGLRKDGTEFAADIDLGPIAIGKESYVMSVVRDATRRKELEDDLDEYRQRLEKMVAERTAQFAQTNEKLTLEMGQHRRTEEGLELRAAILDNAREAIFLINPKGDFLYANEAAVRTYGYTREEILRMNLSQLLSAQDAVVIPGRLREVLQTGQLDLEAVHIRKDKSIMPVLVRHSVIKSGGGGPLIVSVMQETSARPAV